MAFSLTVCLTCILTYSVSNDWNRCCCAPDHPLKLEFRQYIPTAADLQGGSPEIADLTADWDRLTGKARREAEQKSYSHIPVALTMIRDGNNCAKFPCCYNKCVGFFICTSCCADAFTLVAGSTNETSDSQIGADLINSLDPALTIGSGQVPVPCGGYCRPELDITRGGESAPFAKMQGPCVFGGWSEMCCDFSFPISKIGSPGVSEHYYTYT